MFKKFTTKELIFIALMGALMFVLSFVLGSASNVLINPVASGFTSALIQPILVVIVALTVRRFGIASIMYFVYSILAIPTNMLGGLPGPFKILLALVMGLSFDVVIWLFKYKKWSFYVAAVVMLAVTIPLMIYLYILLGIPGYEKVLEAVWAIGIIYLIESWIGILIGFWIFKRVKNKRVMRQMIN